MISKFLDSNWGRKLKVLYHFFEIFFKSRIGDVYIVYQMGKVGSYTIYETLRNEGLYVYHIHRMNKKYIKSIHKEYRHKGVTPPGDIVGLAFNLYLKFFENNFNYIVGMRDPLARNFSSYFQNIERYGDNYSSLQNFIKTYNHEVPFRWFNEEFNKTLRLNISELEGLEDGCCFFQKGKQSVFIYKLETGMERIIKELEKSFGLNIVKRKDANIAKNKEYAEEYSKLKKELSVSKELLDFIYEDDITKSFYTTEEIQKFRERWS